SGLRQLPQPTPSQGGDTPTGSPRSPLSRPTYPKEVVPLPRRLIIRTGAVLGVAAVLVVLVATPALAATAGAPSLNSVIDSLRLWLTGILAALATLFLTVGGIRYLSAGGDPAQVERAKVALKSAAIGYALAALAPLVVSILQSVVG
ncbi:MAG: pilin, partial [Acidimicrobiales bacterium]